MKKCILFLCFSFSVLFAQEPFGKHANWYKSFNGFHTGSGNGYAHIYFDKDTIIEGVTYQLMKEFIRTTLQTGSDPNDVMVFIDGVVREFLYKTEDNRVYYYDTARTEEILLYDFNAQLGDTVYFRDTIHSDMLGCSAQPGYVVVGMGVENIDGQDMEYWDIDSIAHGGEFLEGGRIYRDMGILNGNMRTSYMDCTGIMYHANDYTFRCFVNDSIHYQPNWQQDCDYFVAVSTNEFKAISTWVAYPNPTENTIFIETSEYSGTVQLELIDLQGRIISSTSFAEKEPISVDLSPVRSGMYILRISDVMGILLHQERVVKK